MSLISGTAIGAVATAKGRPATRRAHIPALPTLREVADTCPLPATYRPAFIRAARDTGLPLAMLVAVGRVESNLKPDARSSADARGLLQVLPTTAAALQLDVDRPASNILAGARYLAQLLEEFNSTDLALAAYNAGPTAVAEAGGAPSQETLDYVANVTALWRDLRNCR